jgi:intracellular sulfur oxidation DsrE/DsrF family protein
MLDLTATRRSFLGSLAATAAAGVAGLTLADQLMAQQMQKAMPDPSFDRWIGKIRGKHKQVFDAPSINGGLPLAWARVFVMTNEMVGTPAKDVSAILILRHDAIPIGMSNETWQKYKFSEAFKPIHAMTKQLITRNIFWKPNAGDLPLPGMALNELLDAGVMIGLCDMALTVISGEFAKNMNMDAEAVKKEWVDSVFPGIQIVPSGVLAINRAQEKGCTYCYAGEG